MFINKLILTNFKSHQYSHFDFGRTNHFFGDNYTGKTSIGDAIVFCLFGMTKHGYKGYVKDFLQDGKSSLKVEVDLAINEENYIITRTMNSKGTTTIYLNNERVKDTAIEKLIGKSSPFIYCCFPEIFPEEDKSTARAFLFKFLLSEQDEFDKLEKNQSQILKQRKNVDSSKSFFEGQKSILQKQLELLADRQMLAIPSSEVKILRKQLHEELETYKVKIQENLNKGFLLQSKIKTCKDKIIEIQLINPSLDKICPTCYQPLLNNEAQQINDLNQEKLDNYQKEVQQLENELHIEREIHSELLNAKFKIEQKIEDLNRLYSFDATEVHSNEPFTELEKVESKLYELDQQKDKYNADLKMIKHQLGQVANSYQNQINQPLTDTRIELFKQLKTGKLRPDFQITYKNRPFRVLSNSERIRCILEIIKLVNDKSHLTYPIFLDNLESVTHLSPPSTQVITATVKKGAPLTLMVKD
jgi:DNA repair exonuclease SbcCD ATPase subunit